MRKSQFDQIMSQLDIISKTVLTASTWIGEINDTTKKEVEQKVTEPAPAFIPKKQNHMGGRVKKQEGLISATQIYVNAGRPGNIHVLYVVCISNHILITKNGDNYFVDAKWRETVSQKYAEEYDRLFAK